MDDVKANLAETREFLARVRELLHDPDTFCARLGVDPALLKEALRTRPTPAMQAEIDRQVQEDLEAAERAVADAPAQRVWAEKVRSRAAKGPL